MTLMISSDVWSAKLKMQILLCSSLILPNFVTLQKSPFAMVTSPPPQAGISSQITSHMPKPHRNRNGGALWAPALPRHLCSRSCSCCGSKKPAIPTAAMWLGAPPAEFTSDQPRADTEVLSFSVTTLSSSKKNLTALLPSTPSADKFGWSGPTGSKVLRGRDEDINRAWVLKPP